MLKYIHQKTSFKYLLVIGLTIGALFAALYFWIATKQRTYILAQVEKQAFILHRQIVLTRQWVSDHSYVYIAGDHRDPSGYLLQEPALETVHGKVYTRITPASLTRRLSQYATDKDYYSFNLTNLQSKNPGNRPDPFEAAAITAFREGRVAQASRLELRNGHYVFRYAAPLFISASCLSCHHGPQYQIGAVGGCISVLIPCQEAMEAVHSEHRHLFWGMAGLTLSVVLILFAVTQKLIFRPIGEIRRITARIREKKPGQLSHGGGDELKEVAGLCYQLDETLERHHQELEEQIQAATSHLQATNQQLEAANQELIRLNNAKSEFFSDISHELRTPLTAIKGAADFLARKSGPDRSQYLEIIQKNSRQLTRIILDFLDVSKIQAGRLELEVGEHCLAEIASEVFEALKPMAEEKGLRIDFSGSRYCTARMDRQRIYQVISNLISNAIRFSPAGGSIAVQVDRLDGFLQLAVTDQGPGIAPDHCESIFNKFYQAPQEGVSTGFSRGSAGIGLAICKGLVAAHGGTIAVESRLGMGSRFYFRLPIGGPTVDGRVGAAGKGP